MNYLIYLTLIVSSFLTLSCSDVDFEEVKTPSASLEDVEDIDLDLTRKTDEEGNPSLEYSVIDHDDNSYVIDLEHSDSTSSDKEVKDSVLDISVVDRSPSRIEESKDTKPQSLIIQSDVAITDSHEELDKSEPQSYDETSSVFDLPLVSANSGHLDEVSGDVKPEEKKEVTLSLDENKEDLVEEGEERGSDSEVSTGALDVASEVSKSLLQKGDVLDSGYTNSQIASDVAVSVGEELVDVVSDKDVSSEVYVAEAPEVTAITETINQKVQVGGLDVLVVLDPSSSMKDEREHLGEKMSLFFDSLTNVDWRLGVISSDSISDKGSLKSFSNGELYLTSNSVDYESEFLNLMTQSHSTKGWGILTNAIERPIESVMRSLKNPSNQSFFRASSRLVVVFITNDDEEGGKDKDDLISAVELKFGSKKSFEAYGFLIKSGDRSCYEAQSGRGHVYGKGNNRSNQNRVKYGKTLESLISEVKGLSYSICLNDYGDFLKQVAEKSKRVTQNRFKLNHTPVAGTVEVSLSPKQSISWVLVGDFLVFKHPPQVSTKISVKYQTAD